MAPPNTLGVLPNGSPPNGSLLPVDEPKGSLLAAAGAEEPPNGSVEPAVGCPNPENSPKSESPPAAGAEAAAGFPPGGGASKPPPLGGGANKPPPVLGPKFVGLCADEPLVGVFLAIYTHRELPTETPHNKIDTQIFSHQTQQKISH